MGEELRGAPPKDLDTGPFADLLESTESQIGRVKEEVSMKTAELTVLTHRKERIEAGVALAAEITKESRAARDSDTGGIEGGTKMTAAAPLDFQLTNLLSNEGTKEHEGGTIQIREIPRLPLDLELDSSSEETTCHVMTYIEEESGPMHICLLQQDGELIFVGKVQEADKTSYFIAPSEERYEKGVRGLDIQKINELIQWYATPEEESEQLELELKPKPTEET